MHVRPVPGHDLLLQVRSGFVSQGTSYSAWCRANGILRSSATQALTGAWNGPKARALRDKIIKAALPDAGVTA